MQTYIQFTGVLRLELDDGLSSTLQLHLVLWPEARHHYDTSLSVLFAALRPGLPHIKCDMRTLNGIATSRALDVPMLTQPLDLRVPLRSRPLFKNATYAMVRIAS